MRQSKVDSDIDKRILYNMSALSAWRNGGGRENGEPVRLMAISPYPLRAMSRADQLLLAVGNITFQEVKDAQIQTSGWETGRDDLMYGWKGSTFRARFSLNQGDMHALRAEMLDTGLAKSPSMEIPFEYEDGRGPGSWTGEGAPSLVMTMPRATKDSVTIRYAYRDGAEEFGRRPSVVIEMSMDIREVPLTQEAADGTGEERYTTTVDWSYDIYMVSTTHRVPNDTMSRQRYDAARGLLRAALSSIGVTPSRLG